MLRSHTVHIIRDLAQSGRSIRAIAEATGLARNTVRKYLRERPTARPRPGRPSKLDPFKDQIRRWVHDDRLLNCETMLERLRPLGYTGSVSILKAFVAPLRPPAGGRQPVQRFETAPGQQLQIDWGEFSYLEQETPRKLYGFTAVLGYSRMRFVCFMKRLDTPSLIRGLMQACIAFGGLPDHVLSDRMKQVLLTSDGSSLRWNPQWSDFLAALGVTPRVCRPYAPQTKGKIERTIGVLKANFWPGIHCSDLDDLNRQAQEWCDRRNRRVHATTGAVPAERLRDEALRPLPTGYAWQRFTLEPRQVSRDGFISFDGVRYGVPAAVCRTSRTVMVGVEQQTVQIWADGHLVAEHAVRAASGAWVVHPAQFTDVAPTGLRLPTPAPLGHQVTLPETLTRPLEEYDRLFGMRAAEVPA